MIAEPGVTKVASAIDHYDDLLAEHYIWMSGPFFDKVAEQRTLFEGLGIAPCGSLRALDLGCGPGYQAIALAELGFEVTAMDTSEKLLAQLAAHKASLPIVAREARIEDLRKFAQPGFSLAVCMGDTLTHLESKDSVCRLFDDVRHLLEPGGRLVLAFREFTAALTGLDRFIPVRSDGSRIMTCFLEYEPETVIVHDLVHIRRDEGWDLKKSSYRKLRLSTDWVADRLLECGLDVRLAETRNRMSLMVAERRDASSSDDRA